MWQEQPLIYPDEDEEALKSRFVELSAIYPNHSIFDIAAQVMINQRDPGRSQKIALVWGNLLEIKERIRLCKLNGNKEPEVITKEKLKQKILTVTEDMTLDYREKKIVLEGYMNYAKVEGWDMNNNDNQPTANGAEFLAELAKLLPK